MMALMNESLFYPFLVALFKAGAPTWLRTPACSMDFSQPHVTRVREHG